MVCCLFVFFFLLQVVFVANPDTRVVNYCKIHLMAAAFAFAHVNLVRELCMWPKVQFGPKHWINARNKVQSPLEPCCGQWSLRGGRWVCVTTIWEIENVGNSWKKSSAVLQILRGKSQPTPDVDMVDLEHMKCCGFNSCSQSAFF